MKYLSPVVGLQDKGSQLFNVVAYGAKGDGSTDDTTAIQAALDAAGTAGGGVVFAPAATYITSNLTIHAKTTLMGTGRGSSIKAKTGTTGNLIALNTPASDVAIGIENIRIDGNNLASLTGILLDNTAAAQDTLHRLFNVWVYNCAVDGFKLGPAVIESALVNCFAYNSGRYGFNFDVAATDNRMINCSSGLSANHGFYVQGNNNHFIGCKAYYAGSVGAGWTNGINGFMLYPSASQDLHLVSLVSCEAQNNAQDGFHLEATASSATMQHINVVNCMADGNNEANNSGVGFYVNSAQYSTLNGNTTRSQSPAHTYGLALYGNLNKTFIGTGNDFNGATAAVYTDSGVSNYGNAINVWEKTAGDSSGVGGIDAPFGSIAAHNAVQRFINFNGVQQYVAKYGAADWYVNNSTSTNEVNALTVAFDHIDTHSLPINNVADPTTAQGAATKHYVDTPRVTSTASSATPTPNVDTTYEYVLTALAAGATFGAPTGTPADGQALIIRVKDNASPQTLAFNAAYRFSTDLVAPTTTVASKTLYMGFRYNAADSKWDCLALLNNF